MMHLNYDELFLLAEAASEQDGFDDIQIQQLEHLKNCQDCYESFCLLSALSDVTGEAGSLMLDVQRVSAVQEIVTSVTGKVLARIQIIRDSAAAAAGAVLEQINQAGAALQFGPSFAMATRGAGDEGTSAVRIEEFEDDKTFVIFKPEKNELSVQINPRNLDIENVKVYVEFEDGARAEVTVEHKGAILKGTLQNVPEGNFNLVIEAE